MNASPVSPPGVRSPAVGFEQPFEMLQACHKRVQRSLDLLQRLIADCEARGYRQMIAVIGEPSNTA